MTVDDSRAKLSISQWILLLSAAGLIAFIGILLLRTPGYMDADYYFLTSKWISQGEGFWERILWNYLDDPQGIPHPSHLYWLPLTSIIAAIPMLFFEGSYLAAQAPFAVLMIIIVFLATWTSLELNQNPRMAIMSGMLAIFSGFYLPFLLTTDTFTPFAVIGSLTLILLSGENKKAAYWLLIGLLIALAHLTRADGVLLLGIAIISVIQSKGYQVSRLLFLFLGYLTLMLPWWIRNLQVVGSVMAPGGDRILWLLSYDELYTFPGDILTFQRWISTGLLDIFHDRLAALWTNLQSVIAVNGLIFLLPLMVMGLWHFRKVKLIQLTVLYGGLLLLAMSFIFPYIGARGAFFHSSAALMPILWAVTPMGLRVSIQWIGERRKWNIPRAESVFGVTAVILALGLTLWLFVNRVFSPMDPSTQWGASNKTYQSVGEILQRSGTSGEVVSVNNPPGFTTITGIDSVVIPNGEPDSLYAAIQQYGVGWVVLEANHPQGLDDLYLNPDSVSWLQVEKIIEDSSGSEVFIYKVVIPELET